MHYKVKIQSHDQACKETARWLGASRYVLLRSELAKCTSVRQALQYAYMAGGIAGYSGRAVVHALVREASAHRQIQQLATDVLAEGIAEAKPSCKRQGSCNNVCPEPVPCDSGKCRLTS